MPRVEAILYSSWRSSCSYRVRICLNLENIKFELKPVDSSRLASAAGFATYTQYPMNYVPAIDINGRTLIESMAIMEYLEEVFPEIPLMPKGSFKRAQVRAICGIIVAGIQSLKNASVLNKIGDLTNRKKKKSGANTGSLKVSWPSKSSSNHRLENIAWAMKSLWAIAVPQVFNARRLIVCCRAIQPSSKRIRSFKSIFLEKKVEDPSTFPFELFEPGEK